MHFLGIHWFTAIGQAAITGQEIIHGWKCHHFVVEVYEDKLLWKSFKIKVALFVDSHTKWVHHRNYSVI